MEELGPQGLEEEVITPLPLVHGRLAFAIEARRRMLATRWDAIAVELPPSLESAVHQGLDLLPKISVVVYRGVPEFLDPEGLHLWYVPIDPCDGIVETLRVARGERTPVHFVDAEVDDFRARPVTISDPHALHGLGLETWYQAVQPWLTLQERTDQDEIRERHMAARLQAIQDACGPDGRVLFVCGLAHWEGVRRHLDEGTGRLHDSEGPTADQVTVTTVSPASLPHVLGETPHTAWRWEEHRAGIALEDFDAVFGLKDLLMEARAHYEAAFPDALERATPRALETMLSYTRKMCVRRRRLIPDTWTLATAAKGCVGNDFAISVLRSSSRYPPNGEIEDLEVPPDELPEEGPYETADDPLDEAPAEPERPAHMTRTLIETEHGTAEATCRTPGEAAEWRRLPLRRRPERKKREIWERGWDPGRHCSWPPEDVVIENFRNYVSQRALGLAGLSLVRTEPFTSSFKDGIALRETLRDWHRRRIHVKEEPRVAGDVGALVLIFEEDDLGLRFPWRTTWMAEHQNESTLAFYSTDPADDIVGPGLGRIFYGGCMFIFPPMLIPDVWEDMRFERARRPSERLLLAALWYGRDRYVAYSGPTPPSPEAKQQAEALGKHIVYVPLSSFSSTTLERLRRAHVLNGHEVRSWADRFIR